MNKADSERLGAGLQKLGYSPAAIEDADIVVVNSCVVRHSAENRVLSKLGALKPLKRARPDVLIALTGCLVDSRKEELRRRFPQVDVFMRPQEFGELLEVAASRAPAVPRDDFVLRPAPAVFVPVIHGCNKFCSYCIVPYRRGREHSRPIPEVVTEVEELVAHGAREVTLLGQNVDSYGRDLPERPNLADLLTAVNRIEGVERIRFLTSHPRDMTSRLIHSVARLEKVCKHISVPLQAGDDAILKAMRRGYTVNDYRKLVQRIRRTIPGVALATDVIVGFPGESEAQFERTFSLLQELRFDTVHVAAYSPRPGTLAARKLPDNVPGEEKRRCLAAIERLQEGIAAEINAALLGQRVEVLVEGLKRDKWQGRTRTGKLVFFSHAADQLGKLVEVEIEKTSPWSLQGRLVE